MRLRSPKRQHTPIFNFILTSHSSQRSNMKLACSVVLVTLFVVIESSEDRISRAKRGFRTGASDRFSHGFGKRDPRINYEDYQKRLGFRHGASDRFSHGFGKRDEEQFTESKPSFTSEQLVDILADNPTLVETVREEIYRNLQKREADGVLSQDEIMSVRERK